MKLIKLLNPQNVSEEEVKNYSTREASRAVVFDYDNKIALLHISKENYYKLPGGGIEEREDKITALNRECLEEIGCKIEVINEVGLIVEYRKINNEKQTSYCYIAKVKGDKGQPNFTDEEKSKGFEATWFTYEEAIKRLRSGESIFGKDNSYIIPRDIAFLEEAKNYF